MFILFWIIMDIELRKAERVGDWQRVKHLTMRSGYVKQHAKHGCPHCGLLCSGVQKTWESLSGPGVMYYCCHNGARKGCEGYYVTLNHGHGWKPI